jgi:hypothetical protein
MLLTIQRILDKQYKHFHQMVDLQVVPLVDQQVVPLVDQQVVKLVVTLVVKLVVKLVDQLVVTLVDQKEEVYNKGHLNYFLRNHNH